MSRRITALQAALRIPLLVHDGRTVRLTREAHRLATRIRVSLDEIDHVVAEVTGDADPDHGTVRFGFPLTMGSGVVPDLLADFRWRHPGIRVLLKQANGSELCADLLAGDLDLAVVIPAPDRIRHSRIGDQKIFAVLPIDHRLSGAGVISLSDLAGEMFIANPSSYHLRRVTESWCREAGYTPDIGIEVTEFATIRELVGRGLGVALLPHDERAPDDTIEVTLVGGDYTRSIALASGVVTPAPPALRLREYLRAHLTPPT